MRLGNAKFIFKTGIFFALLFLFAWSGKLGAERWVLPFSPPRKDILMQGSILQVPEKQEALYVSKDAKLLRDFIFSIQNKLPVPAHFEENIFPIAAGTSIETMESDADMVKIKVHDGALKGQIFWIKSKPFLENLKHPSI